MEKNQYAAMKERQQTAVNLFPIMVALSDEQFDAGMKELCVSGPTDLLKIGNCMFIRKSDREAYEEMIDRFDRDLRQAMESDRNGDGFLYEMFLHVMRTEECGYDGGFYRALERLDITREKLEGNPALEKAYTLARNAILDGD